MRSKPNPKKAPQTDWHPADIVAELRKAGWSLRGLSAHHGYNPHALKEALQRRWPKAQQLIADAIGVKPEQIWPSRYPKKQPRRAATGRVAA